jgi:hypothetical protein
MKNPTHLANYIITQYNKDTQVALLTPVNIKGEPLSPPEEYHVSDFAKEDFEKLLPLIPCIFFYIEEDTQKWACTSVLKQLKKETPPTK